MTEGKHYQNAYVTSDLDQALDRFDRLFETRSVVQFESSFPALTPEGTAEFTSRLAFVWVGDLQYELIQPVHEPIPLFGPLLPENELLALHHTCTRVPDWEALRKELDDPVVLEGGGDELKFLYVDARPVLGHYLEYTWMTDERWAQLGGR